MSSYLNYPARSEPEPSPAGGYQVVIEYANEGEAKPPTLLDIRSTIYPTREEAVRAARRAAFVYNPPDPWAPQDRTVYTDGPDAFLVVVQGAMSLFHFSVRVVRQIGPPVEDA